MKMETSFIILALLIFAIASLPYVVHGENDSITQQNPVSCSKVTSLENFETITDDEKNEIRVLYRGVHKECQLYGNNSLRIELERIFPLASITMVSIEDLNNPTRVPGNIRFTAVGDVSSENSVSYDNCQLESAQRATNNGVVVFESRCKFTSLENSSGTMASVIEMKPKGKEVLILNLRRSMWKLQLEPQENHKGHCLRPGKYPTQTLKNPRELYRVNETVSYCNGHESPCDTNRTCTENGWSGSPPRPSLPGLTNYSRKEQVVSIGQKEAIFQFSQDLLNISTIYVDINLPCENTLYIRHESKISVSIEKVIQTANYWTRKSHEAHAEGCSLAFGQERKVTKVDCLNCTVKVTLSDDLIKSLVKAVSILGWNTNESDSYDWMKNGCPPIDPYVGMPEEYANDASKYPDILNSYLRSEPCRDGYRLSNGVVRNNPRQCIENSWIGNVPKCQLITCRRPPEIDHGKWHYANETLYHQVQYTCDTSLFLSGGTGIATCNYEANKWENVPICLKTQPSTSLKKNSNFFVAESLAGVVLLIALVSSMWFFFARIRKTNAKAVDETAYANINTVTEDYYVNPITRHLQPY